MPSMVKHVEGKYTHFLVPIGKSFDSRPVFLNATDAIFDAMRRDRKMGYSMEEGPNYGIERQHAEDYADFVGQYATRENLHKFDTRAYRMFVGAMTENEMAANKQAKESV